MGYQALLFCPDEKTARTVTQVLSELEFAVESCAEPFAAVKKLMGQHFDAVVVDCDNEQNATLLFKSARNSTSNQASLAVAVVEGQAGVAKAFRIGANLVLTKPINIEQAKGTLRVARGLLRKGDPAKPAATTATPATPAAQAPTVAPTATAAVPAKPVAAKPAAPPKPAAPAAPKTLSAAIANPRPIAPPVARPAAPIAAAPASAMKAAISVPVAKAPVAKAPVASPITNEDDLLGIADEAKISQAQVDAKTVPTASPLPAVRPTVNPAAPTIGGAASAPAPARIPESRAAESAPASKAVEDEPLFDKPAEVKTEPSSHIGSEPTFTFGGANVAEPSGGGSKKILVGVAAAVLVAAAGYFGWTKFQESNTANSATTAATPAPKALKPAITPAAPVSQPAAAPDITLSTVPDSSAKASATPASVATPSKSEKASSVAPSSVAPSPVASGTDTTAPTSLVGNKKAAAAKQDAPALVVKGGSAPVLQAKSVDPDAPAPGIEAPSAGAAMPNLGSTSSKEARPVLQALTVSQGVSQGLLLKKVQPFYPKGALAMQVEGSVEIMATISKTGDISHVTVVSGDAQLTKAAADAVKQWKYKPYLLNGEPVEIQTQVTINFKLPK